MSRAIDEARARTRANREREGDYVLYWMQRSQRARTDHAREHALRVALELSDRWLLDGRDPSSYAMDGAA
ncbi:MAG: hypothetical protein RLO52_06440 [Sandaracinaceae bacterium]